MNAIPTGVLVVGLACCGWLSGYVAGTQPNPNVVEVPAQCGAPADLPAWARDELVNLRVENLRYMREEARRTGLFVHYRVRPEDGCK